MAGVEEELWDIFTFYSLHGNPLDPTMLSVRDMTGNEREGPPREISSVIPSAASLHVGFCRPISLLAPCMDQSRWMSEA